MSALDLFSLDWLCDQVRDYLAVRRPGCAVIYGTEQDLQFASAQEERVVIGAQKDHQLLPPGPSGAPGPTTLAGGIRVAPFATLRQGAWIAIRAICAPNTPDPERAKESQRRAFAVLRWVLNAIERADSGPGDSGSTHGSNTVRAAKVELWSPETADYQHGALIILTLAIDVPVYGEERLTVQVVQENPGNGETRLQMRVEACDDTTCQVVMETT